MRSNQCCVHNKFGFQFMCTNQNNDVDDVKGAEVSQIML